MAAPDLDERVHVRRLTREVDRDDRPGSRRDRRLRGRRIQVERVEVHVREHRHRVGFDHCRRRGHKRIGRHNHFVVSADSCSHQRHAQRNRAVHHRNTVAAPVHGGEARLERRDLRPLQTAPMTAAKDAKQTRLLGRADDRPRRERPGANRCAAEEREWLVNQTRRPM